MAESMYGTNDSFVQTTAGSQIGQVSDQFQSNYSSGASYQGLTQGNQAALDMLISQLMGGSTEPQMQPLLEEVPWRSHQYYGGGGIFSTPGISTSYFVDPTTGQRYSAEQGRAINKQRQSANEQLAIQKSSGAVSASPVEDIRRTTRERQTEIGRTRGIQETFSQERAAEVAKSLSDYFSRQLGETAIQSITRGAEAAGTSASSARALLSQEAVQRASEVAAKTGADLSTQYGGIQANLANTLEALTRIDPNNPVSLLLNALQTGRISQQANVGGGSGQQSSRPVQLPTTEVTTRNYSGDQQLNTLEGIYNTNITQNQSPGAFYNAPGDYTSNDLNSGSGYITVGGENTYEF